MSTPKHIVGKAAGRLGYAQCLHCGDKEWLKDIWGQVDKNIETLTAFAELHANCPMIGPKSVDVLVVGTEQEKN